MNIARQMKVMHTLRFSNGIIGLKEDNLNALHTSFCQSTTYVRNLGWYPYYEEEHSPCPPNSDDVPNCGHFQLHGQFGVLGWIGKCAQSV